MSLLSRVGVESILLFVYNTLFLLWLSFDNRIVFALDLNQQSGYFRFKITPISKGGVLNRKGISFGTGLSRREAVNKCVSEMIERYCLSKKKFYNSDIVVVRDLITLKDKLLSSGYVYKERHAMLSPYFPFNSNGVAAHIRKDKAIEHAIFEVIERDGFMCHWYTRTIPKRITIESCPINIQSEIMRLNLCGYSLTILDITTEISIPSVCLVISLIVNDEVRYVVSSASHYTYECAILRALAEFEVVRPNLYLDFLDDFRQQRYYRGKNSEYIEWMMGGDKEDIPIQQNIVFHKLKDLVSKIKDQKVLNVSVYEYPKDAKPQGYRWMKVVKVIIPQLCPFILRPEELVFCESRLKDFATKNGKSFVWNQSHIPLN